MGNLKGVDRVYQETFIDTYSKVALAKLCDRNNAIVPVELSNDRAFAFFEEHHIPLSRIPSDRLSTREYHECQLYLSIEGIENTKNKDKVTPNEWHLQKSPAERPKRILSSRIQDPGLPFD